MAIFNGIVHIHALPRDGSDFPSGVAWVDIFIDGTLLERKSTEPFIFVWDTRNASNGGHQIAASAADQSGNIGFAPLIDVTVDNLSPIFKLALFVDGKEVASGPAPLTHTLTIPKQTPPRETKVQLKVDKA